MAGFFDQFVTQLSKGDEIRDYQHATRTFVDGLYRLNPKLGSMFHVYIDVNSQIKPGDPTEIGLMAKAVTLPKFTIQTKTYNAYNRKNIAQEKINYDPISITFHDDSSNVVRDFWQGYYQYYYNDWNHQESQYVNDDKYQKRQSQDWGFGPRTSGTNAVNYINSIRIYSLHQKYYSSYILMKPTITSFAHGQHVAGEYTPLEHTMQVAYEAVHYESGPVSAGSVLGFSNIHYDKTPSPLTAAGGSTTSILGPGGLADNAAGIKTNLANGNFAAAALGTLRGFTAFKNTNIKNIAKAELAQTASNILRGQNTQSTIFVPTASSIRDALAKAVAPNKKSSSGTMN
jgi:hypothetical protein